MTTPLFDPAAPPRRILAICTRRLGDVLLTTALLRSLRRAWPRAELDVLTLRWSAPALEGNPDVTRVIPIAEGAGLGESLRAIGGFRRYDLALSTLLSDRAHLTALWASSKRACLVDLASSPWKRWLATAVVDYASGGRHTVAEYLALAEALGIPRCEEVVPPRAPASLPPGFARGNYAVVHPAAMFRYKGWTVAGWRALVDWLVGQGLRVALDAGPGDAERAYLEQIAAGAAWPADAVVPLPGTYRFPELTPLLEGASVYVGPDTGITHLAAATGVPTVALFGPMNPALWGPWPRGGAGGGATPWQTQRPLQQRGNVWVLQGLTHCAPCQMEGCERHRDSRADCLQELPPSRVIAAVDAALRQNGGHGHPR